MFFRKKKTEKRKKKNGKKRIDLIEPDDKGEFENQWKKLYKGVFQLIDFLESKEKVIPFDLKEHSQLYSIVYNLCTQKVTTGKLGGGPTEILYHRYGHSMSEYLDSRVVPALMEVGKEELLSVSIRRWRDHQIIVNYMRKLFIYLDRYYTKHNNRDSLNTVGLKMYKALVYSKIKKNMARALLEQILRERQGESIDRSTMKDGIMLFIEMGLQQNGKDNLETYKSDFEKALIKDTAEHYKTQSQIWIDENDCTGYMKCAEEKLQEEESRARSYLHLSTENELIKTVENEVIKVHSHLILFMENSGFNALMMDLEGKKDDLQRMYRLFKRGNLLEGMADLMREFLKKEGMSILQKYQEEEKVNVKGYIESLINSHEKYLNLVNKEFQQDPLFKERLKDAFTHFINTDLENNQKNTKTSTAELLSLYCDSIMKNTDRLGEDNLDQLLDKIIRLFGYISDKDMFQEFYRRLLSKRLLTGNRTNLDAERNFIAKLKMKCGASFTSKLEGMIKDKSLSSDLQNEFKAHIKENPNKMNKIDFTPTVLTTGFWPSFKMDQLIVPQDIVPCLQSFQEFYDKRTESRTLTWIHSLGKCQVQGFFKSGKKTFLCSIYQTLILLLFNNEGTSLTTLVIQKTLGLFLDDVKKNLLSLFATKNNVLKKRSGKNKCVRDTDTFEVNDEFKSNSSRINLFFTIRSFKRKKIQKHVNDDRKYAIDAAIVRIMKARKSMEHPQLILEVTRQSLSHFRPDPKLIKRRIESLIERDYLERDDKKASLYKYLA